MTASPLVAYAQSSQPFLPLNDYSPTSLPTSSSASAMDGHLTTAPKQNGISHLPGSQSNGHSDGDLSSYSFPDHRLRRKLEDPSKTPLVLVSCGSFSPITNLHLRMFEMVADHVKFHTPYEVVGGYFSPVSDDYKKAGLASAHHR
jgi:hypothetical protein